MVNTALFTNAPAEPRPVPALTAVVYHTEWNSFTQASHQTRYTIRWRHDLGILVLKVTDDVQCIKFKTRSGAFINRFEAFNLAMQTKMHGSEPPASVEAFPVAARDTPSNGAVQQLEVDAIGRLARVSQPFDSIAATTSPTASTALPSPPEVESTTRGKKNKNKNKK